MGIIFFLIFGVWLYSYIMFRRKFNVNKMMCEFTHRLHEEDPSDTKTTLEYTSALMLCQQYRSALNLFQTVRGEIPNANKYYPFLDVNIEFCKKPLPWSTGAKDHKGGSWWHNFQLARFGGPRQPMISAETALAFNSMLRMMNRR